MGAHLSHHRNHGLIRRGNIDDDDLTIPRSFNVNDATYKPEFDVKMKLRFSMGDSLVDNATEIDLDDNHEEPNNNNNSKVVFELSASLEDKDRSGQNTPVISRQNTPDISHQNDTVISHQNTSVISQQNDTVISHQNISVISQQNDTAISHQNDTVISHQTAPVISHQNTPDIWRPVRAEKNDTDDEGHSELKALARVDEMESTCSIESKSAAGSQVSCQSPTPNEDTNVSSDDHSDGDYEVGLLQEILSGYDHWELDVKHGAAEEGDGTIKAKIELHGKQAEETHVSSPSGESKESNVTQLRCEPDGADDLISTNTETNVTTVLVANDKKTLSGEDSAIISNTDTSASPAFPQLPLRKSQVRQESKKWKSGGDEVRNIYHKNNSGEKDTEIVTKAIRKISSTLSNKSSSTVSSMPNVRSINDMDEWMTWRMRINHQLASIVLKTSKPGLSLATKYPAKMSHTVIKGVVEGIAQEAPISKLDRPSYLVYGIPRATVRVVIEQSRSDISR